MTEAGWMLVVLVVACLAYRRMGKDTADTDRIKRLEMDFSAWPEPSELLERMDEFEESLKKLGAEGATLGPLVTRLNDFTRDMLALKTVVAEHRETIALLRSKNSLRALSGNAD